MTKQKIDIKQSGMRWLWLALLVFVLDITTKQLVVNYLVQGWGNAINIFPSFNLVYVKNTGAAFSFLSEAGGYQRWLFSFLALVISLFLANYMRQISKYKYLENIAYACVIGGAIGNLFDRVVNGYVIDFLDIYIGNYHWPAFNVADIAISIGASLVIIDSIKNRQ